MITLETLKNLSPSKIFAYGEDLIKHPWWNGTENNGAYKTCNEEGMTKVKWVAIRVGIHDWAIYHSLNANFERSDFMDGNSHLNESEERIASYGAKLYDIEKIRELVPCDDEAFEMYRF